MLEPRPAQFNISPHFKPLIEALGLTAEKVFTDPRIVVWRSITERENCTLDIEFPDGKTMRLHVKRYLPAYGFLTPADEEARGIRALEIEKIPTAPLVAHGKLPDRRSFVITADLAGYRAADKLIAEGYPFEKLLECTADLAAALHTRGLHHRDLYLCHFFVKPEETGPQIRLIDAARVRRLPGFITRRRWIVKDLAQFWYSTLALPISNEQRKRWLDRYTKQHTINSTARLQKSIERKSDAIARHDKKLKAVQPKRNVSIPGA